MLDILLINPPWYRGAGNIWKSIGSCQPPFGLALLAAVVRREGFESQILDCNALQIGLDNVSLSLPKDAPRFVGLTATTVLIESAISVARIIKAAYPQTKVIIGGVHATVMPEEVLSEWAVDYIVFGEGELTLPDILNGVPLEEIAGMGYKRDGKIIINQPREVLSDINLLPRPLYEILPMDKYYPAPGSYKRKPAIGMMTSRGCPGRCTFCKGNIFGERIRFRSAENILEEIVFLQKCYGIKEVEFYDDTFTANRPNIKKFCELVLSKQIDLTWSCFSRVDTVDAEMLDLMRMAGCHQVMFGVESADETILKNINKKITLAKVEETVTAAKKARVDVRLTFMFGNPGETEATMERTLQYAIKLNPELVNFNITTPYPGTEMFRWAKENGCVMHTNWGEYNLSKPVMKLPTVSNEKIIEYYKKAHSRFYFRLSYFLMRIKKIHSIESLWWDLKSFLSLVGFSLRS